MDESVDTPGSRTRGFRRPRIGPRWPLACGNVVGCVGCRWSVLRVLRTNCRLNSCRTNARGRHGRGQDSRRGVSGDDGPAQASGHRRQLWRALRLRHNLAGWRRRGSPSTTGRPSPFRPVAGVVQDAPQTAQVALRRWRCERFTAPPTMTHPTSAGRSIVPGFRSGAVVGRTAFSPPRSGRPRT